MFFFFFLVVFSIALQKPTRTSKNEIRKVPTRENLPPETSRQCTDRMKSSGGESVYKKNKHHRKTTRPGRRARNLKTKSVRTAPVLHARFLVRRREKGWVPPCKVYFINIYPGGTGGQVVFTHARRPGGDEWGRRVSYFCVSRVTITIILRPRIHNNRNYK